MFLSSCFQFCLWNDGICINRLFSNYHYHNLYFYYDGHPQCIVYSFLQVKQIHHLALWVKKMLCKVRYNDNNNASAILGPGFFAPARNHELIIGYLKMA